jgi:hypothetical protein
MRKVLIATLTFVFLASLLTGVVAAATVNEKCLACHADKAVSKLVAGETVPLYVDAQQYAQAEHGNLECTKCHVDVADYPHDKVRKTYGSWARFSKKDDDVSKTRNYYTAASTSCTNCHAKGKFMAFAQSEHATINDQRAAHLTKPVGSDGKGYEVGEDFIPADCQRCHLTCATCHFESTIRQKKQGDVKALWSKYDADSDKAKSDMTEYGLDWTTNVASHRFRTAPDLSGSNVVCQSCHIGYYQGDVNKLAIGVVGMGVRRHPQVQELQFSAQRGVHETKQTCAACHTDVHELTITTTKLAGRIGGAAECAKCHAAQAKRVTKHEKVSCVACHDAELTTFQFDPETGKIEPVAVKHLLMESWPSHNLAKAVRCAKCHTADNRNKFPEKVQAIAIHQ